MVSQTKQLDRLVRSQPPYANRQTATLKCRNAKCENQEAFFSISFFPLLFCMPFLRVDARHVLAQLHLR